MSEDQSKSSLQSSSQMSQSENMKNQATLNVTEIMKIAHLAKLKLTHDEALELSSQLSKVIAHFDEISTVNTHNIEPLITPSDLVLKLREDVATQDYTAEEMLKNAPDRQGQLFKVPPVV